VVIYRVADDVLESICVLHTRKCSCIYTKSVLSIVGYYCRHIHS